MFHSALLISRSALAALQQSIALAPTIAERLAFEEAHAAANRNGPKIASRDGRTAYIEVSGVLTPSPDLFSKLMGGGNTTYGDVMNALVEAEGDPSVDRIVLQIDSPGGTVAGLFETLDIISALTKPISAQVACACSAAYAIAAATGNIEATSVAAMVGSVGVAVSFFVPDDVVHVANTASPNKRPDVKTDAGKKLVREELDALYGVFVEAIARGRGTSPAAVSKDFGKGGIVIARDALARGMIDRIAPPRSALPGSDMAAAERMIARMDAIRSGEFKPRAGESHPDFCKRMAAEALGYETEGQRRRPQPNRTSLLDAAADAYCSDDVTDQGIDRYLEQHAPTKADGKSLLEQAADVYCDGERDVGDAVCDAMFGEGWENR